MGPSEDPATHARALSEIIHPVAFVPETKKAGELLRQMRSQRIQIPIIIEQYVGTPGNVMLQGLRERVVRPLTDEWVTDHPLVGTTLISNAPFSK